MESGASQTVEIPYATPSTPPPPSSRITSAQWLRAIVILLLAIIAGLMFWRGLTLRKQTWDDTQGVRFVGDVANGFSWGTTAHRIGLFLLYDDLARHGQGNFDYPPLRLAVVDMWAAWAEKNYPQYRSWQNNYDLTYFMLRLNTLAELAASVLVFLLIRHWRIRMDDARRAPGTAPRPFRGCIAGLLGAGLMWFNPAVIWDGHAWPQWDVWLVPFFLGAVMLASVDWWFAAGGLIVIGAFLKGQMLLGAPILLAWPILGLRFGAALRFISGFLFIAAIIVFPWLQPMNPELTWLLLFAVALAFTMPIVLRWKWDWRILLGCAIAALILAWPWRTVIGSSLLLRMAPLGIVGLIMLCRFLPARLTPSVYGLAIGAIVFLMIPLFGARSDWYTFGFQRASMKYDYMLAGTGTYNIPRLLQYYGRQIDDPDRLITLWWTGTRVSYRTLAAWIYGACLLLMGIGAAIQARRNDVRFLVCMAAPWVLFYLIMPQMHGRYLVWGAAMASLLVGVDLGMVLVGGIVIGIAFLNIVYNQYSFQSNWDPQGWRNLQLTNPHLGWALIVAAGVYLYVCVLPRPRLRRA